MRKSLSIFTILSIAAIGSCLKSTAQTQNFQQPDQNYHQVKARANANSPEWTTYTAKTIDRIPGFRFSKDPEINSYGSWKVHKSSGTGFFRTEKKGDRWWIIDPEGYPFIHKGVAVFRPGNSDNQVAALKNKYVTKEKWVIQESQLLKDYGFNGTGAWSDFDLMRETPTPLVYTIIINPMGAYKSDHLKKYGGKYEMAGWQGYRYDLAMVFDPEFESYVEKAVAPIAKYLKDKYLLGYFTDNELPWKNDALDRHLKYLGKEEAGYLAAKKWLDSRKGKDASPGDVTDEDRLAFSGFYFETYIKKVAAAIRKYDPNHMYLGCRFNQEKEELQNPEMFKVAGKYADIISINHYRKWEPVQSIMANWTNWSGRPFIITEWYTKGEDSGLPNRSGAGWNVPTQQDRGYFYQNFTIELLKSGACVGWHWFTYQDNDPLNMNTDPSNRDSNKGIVSSNYIPYKPLLENMKQLNDHVFELIKFLDNCCQNGTYKGTPFNDLIYKSGPQTIPGKLQCEYYDFGGEGIACHDSDTINSGSGRLNPADGSYLNEFRIKEAVDISYTKFRDPAIDNNPFNFVKPEKDQLYVGWTAPGEWTKYTVNVKMTGTYELGIMYTSNQNGKISISVNDQDKTGPLPISSTFVSADSIAWRQWHHWNYIDKLARIYLKKGLQTITVHTVEVGQMNYDYINFDLVKQM